MTVYYSLNILEFIFHVKNKSENLCRLGSRYLYNTRNKEKNYIASHNLIFF